MEELAEEQQRPQLGDREQKLRMHQLKSKI